MPAKGKIGDDVLALEPTKQTAFAKALKTAKNLKVKKEAETAENVSKYKPGIILLNHIPFGFFEKELRGYFSQFGHVLRVRLARSIKTGKSKGYAFIEFEFEDVAKIAAECMDGYLMYERLLKCEVLPQGVNANKIFSKRYIREDNYPKLHARRKVKVAQSKPKSEEDVKDFLQFRLRKLEEQNQKLSDMGIEYKFEPKGLPEDVSAQQDNSAITSPKEKPQPKSPKQERQQKSPKETVLPRLSPKNIRTLKSDISELPKTPKAEKATPQAKQKESATKVKTTPQSKFPKFSPKILRSRKSDISGLSKTPKVEKANTPKAEPKEPRSRKSDISGLSKTPKVEKANTPKAEPKEPASKVEQVQPSKFPKFSPKLLRSRKSDISGLSKSPKVVTTTPVQVAKKAGRKSEMKEPTSDKKPKFSPKMLRSRKSDVSGLNSPFPEKNSPKTKKPVGRKSVR